MEKNPLISVIIPVFNVESYLHQCVDSVLRQSYANIEIILVDDGSSDESALICDYYVNRDNRVKCIHKSNEGVSKARQTGLLNSSGYWILFVDSDDEIPNNSIETLVSEQCNFPNADIIIAGYQYVPKSKFQHHYKKELTTGEELTKKYLKGEIHTGPVAKLIKKSIVSLEDFEIPSEIKMGEDAIMNVRIAQRANGIAIIPNTVYYYFIRKNSVCQNFIWTLAYSKKFEKLLYESLSSDYIAKHRFLIFSNKLNRRVSFLKASLKKILLKLDLWKKYRQL